MPRTLKNARHLDVLKHRPVAEKVRYVCGRAWEAANTRFAPDVMAVKLRERVAKARIRVYRRLGRKLPASLRQTSVREIALAAEYAYTPEPYWGRVVFFRAEEQPIYFYHDPRLEPESIVGAGFFGPTAARTALEEYTHLGWGNLAAGGLEIHTVHRLGPPARGVPCHPAIVRESYAQSLAKSLRQRLDQAYLENPT